MLQKKWIGGEYNLEAMDELFFEGFLLRGTTVTKLIVNIGKMEHSNNVIVLTPWSRYYSYCKLCLFKLRVLTIVNNSRSLDWQVECDY